MTDLLDDFFKPRQAPQLAVDARTYTAEEWFSFLFSTRQTHLMIDHRSDDLVKKTLDRRLILLSYLLKDEMVLDSYASDFEEISSQPQETSYDPAASKSILEHAVMRDMLLDKLGKAPSREVYVGDMVIDYAAIIVRDSTYFRNVYLGKVSIDDAVKGMRFKPANTANPTPGTTINVTPEQNLAAKTLLEHYPMMDMQNPPVNSLAELSQIITANVIYGQIRSEPIQQMVRDAVARPDLSVTAKLMYASFMFHIGYVQFLDETLKQSAHKSV